VLGEKYRQGYHKMTPPMTMVLPPHLTAEPPHLSLFVPTQNHQDRLFCVTNFLIAIILSLGTPISATEATFSDCSEVSSWAIAAVSQV